VNKFLFQLKKLPPELVYPGKPSRDCTVCARGPVADCCCFLLGSPAPLGTQTSCDTTKKAFQGQEMLRNTRVCQRNQWGNLCQTQVQKLLLINKKCLKKCI